MSEYPQSIIASAGDTVQGHFKRAERGVDRNGKEHPIAILEIGGEERSYWVLRAAQRSQFKKLRPKAGELVRIELAESKVQSGNGRDYWPDKVSCPERLSEAVGFDDPLWSDSDDDEGAPF